MRRLLFNKEQKRPVTEAGLTRSWIGERFWDVSVDQIPDEVSYKEKLVWYLDKLDENIQTGTGLYLVGPHGSGKSGAAVIVAKEVLSRGGTVLTVSEARLIDAVLRREDYDEEYSVLERAQEVSFLVLDDLGLSPKSDNLTLVETLVKYRFDRRLPTFFTTNLRQKEFLGRYPTIAEAVREACVVVVCEGIDWREKIEQALTSRVKREISQA